MHINAVLIIALILHVLSIGLFLKGRQKTALICLFIGACMLHYWAAALDPFLNDWDEKYHALVGKNLIHHLLRPTLIDSPVLPVDYTNWYGNNVWLHKQPLFLWQIALSIWLFGANEIAVRLPSVLLSSLMVWATYRIGVLAFNERIGFVGALLVSTTYCIIMLVSGDMGMDHNDISFMFYVTCSIWAWLEYERSKKGIWLVLMGAFAGAAVLCKWITGLLVFGLYGFFHLFIEKDFFTLKTLGGLAKSFGIFLLVALPWQLYILHAFPKEAAYEYLYNSRHFYEAVEGHRANGFFYFELLKFHYRYLFPFILAGVFIELYKVKRAKFTLPLILGIAAVYTFFTIAATKMPGYVLMVMPIVFLFLANGFLFVADLLLMPFPKIAKHSVLFLFICLLLYQNMGYAEVIAEHTATPGWYYISREEKIKNTLVFKAAAKIVPPENVLIWCDNEMTVECMFYTNNTAYGTLDEKDVRFLERKGVKIASFYSGQLPTYILNDSMILKLPDSLRLERR